MASSKVAATRRTRRKRTDADEKLTGAWLHLAKGGKKKLVKAHWCTQQTTRPDTAFFAPRGVEQVVMRESRYGGLVGQYSYRLKSPADDQDEEEEGELEKAIADARRPNGKLVVELELTQNKRTLYILTVSSAFASQAGSGALERFL